MVESESDATARFAEGLLYGMLAYGIAAILMITFSRMRLVPIFIGVFVPITILTFFLRQLKTKEETIIGVAGFMVGMVPILFILAIP